MKKIKLNSTDLVKILGDREKVNKDITEIHKILVDADKKHKKLQFKVQRIKDKGVKVLDKVLKEQYPMDEFEYTGQMKIINEKVFEIDIHDALNDIFRDKKALEERLRKDKKEKTNMWADPLMFTGHKDD